MRTLISLAAAAFLAASLPALADRTPAPDGAEVYIITPEDGAVLKNPVTVRFGLKNMGVAPAGTDKEGTGHHHLLINETLEGEELEQGIPADDNHIHFGGGQTEVTLDLPPGTHTLQLVVGDANHIPHDPVIMSKQITVTVEE